MRVTGLDADASPDQGKATPRQDDMGLVAPGWSDTRLARGSSISGMTS